MRKDVSLIISHLQSGGAQRVVSNLSLALSSFYKIYLVLHDGRTPAYPYSGTLVDLKTPVTPAMTGRVFNFINRLLQLRRLKKKVNFQVSISFLESSNLLNLLTAGRSKTIISVRNYKSKQSGGFFGVFYTLVIRLLYGRSDRIVAASRGIKDDLVTNFGLKKEKITVIYNPFNLEAIQLQAGKGLEAAEEEIFQQPVLITAGALSEQKGHRYLLRAFLKIKSEIPAMQLVILGRGELEKELKELAASLKLKDAVHFLGYRDNPFCYFSRSSIFVLPSLYEGFPNVLVEAMACGVPVIATDCRSGPAEILAPLRDFTKETSKLEYAEYGILTPAFSAARPETSDPLSIEEELFSRAVIELYKDSILYSNYRQKSLQRAKNFDNRTIIESWINLIEEK